MKYGRATTDLHAKSNLMCITEQISQYKRTFVQVIVAVSGTAAKTLSSFCIILTKQQTLSVTRPFDLSLALYYKRSIVTMRLSCTVMEIWRLKDNGVTSVTFWGHVSRFI